MAKPIVFQWGDMDLSFSLAKIDRSKLYGYKEVEVLDEDGNRCELATLADDGRDYEQFDESEPSPRRVPTNVTPRV